MPVHAERYAIIDSEVDQIGSLAMESRLRPGIITAVTSALDKQVVERRVFFPMFTRYFLAREQSLQLIIEDLLKHRKTSQNYERPLVLKDDIPCLRHIANKRMGYLRATYRLFKYKVSEAEKDNIALMKLYMKMCSKQYHALIPQLDLIATQWGVNIGDTLFCNDFSTPTKRTPQKLASKKKLEAASATKTRAQLTAKTTGLMIRTDGLVGAAKTAEKGSQIQPGARPLQKLWRPRRGRKSEEEGRFDQESPDGHKGELHIAPAVQTPVHAETYVIIDSEVDQNG
jgi:hypothetical protein